MKYDWLGGKVFLQITLWNGAQQMGNPLYHHKSVFNIRTNFFLYDVSICSYLLKHFFYFHLSYFTTVILLYQVFPLYGQQPL